MDIVIADPAKNITVFVLNPVENRAETARFLLAEASLKAEQVGFVVPPQPPRALWRLEMMGGEFCGNAARSFGLFAARASGVSGSAELLIEISGIAEPLPVQVQTEAGTAAVRIPPPRAWDTLSFGGRFLRVYRFDGITHIIAPDMPPAEKTVFALKAQLEQKSPPPQALGVLFYDTQKRFMTPGVYVYGTDSLLFESSCGSGSGALGLWLCETAPDGEAFYEIAQPGGSIEVRVIKQNGAVQGVSIGGPVSLSGTMRIG